MAGDNGGGVASRADAVMLDKGVDAAGFEAPVPGYADFHNRGIAVDAADVDAVGGAEIPEAVGDEVAFVHFHCAGDVRPVPEYDVCAEVDAKMCEFPRISPVFTEISLGSVWQMRHFRSFGPAVERHDEDVAGILYRIQHLFDGFPVRVVEGMGIVSEGTEAEPFPSDRLQGISAGRQTGIADSRAVEQSHSGFHAFRAEIPRMVIG